MRDEVLAEVRFLRLRKGFSESGIVRQTGFDLEEVRAAIRIVDGASTVKPAAPVMTLSRFAIAGRPGKRRPRS